jgi:histone H3/H4
MSIELPFAPVDTIIRRNAGGLRVSLDATEELALRIQLEGASLSVEASIIADMNGRKTIQKEDFNIENKDIKKDLILPIAPIDRIARLEIDSRYRIGNDARVALAIYLEEYADKVAKKSALLTRHAGRKTIQKEDVQAYFRIIEKA